MWAGPDVCGLLADNVGSLANNLGPMPRILSANLGWKSRCLRVGPRMFAGRYNYLLTVKGNQPTLYADLGALTEVHFPPQRRDHR